VNLAALAPSAIRARWFNPLDGSYSVAGTGLLPNGGYMSFTPPGERVLVLDAG
jgi:Putative collagen-binding domain of a collagenase